MCVVSWYIILITTKSLLKFPNELIQITICSERDRCAWISVINVRQSCMIWLFNYHLAIHLYIFIVFFMSSVILLKARSCKPFACHYCGNPTTVCESFRTVRPVPSFCFRSCEMIFLLSWAVTLAVSSAKKCTELRNYSTQAPLDSIWS